MISWWKRNQYILPIIFCIIAVLTIVVFLIISAYRDFSNFENVLFQLLIAIFGFIGSAGVGYVFSKNSNKKNCYSPFRRMCSLYTSIGRLKNIAENYSRNEADIAIAQITVIVNEQLSATKDALADWEDLMGEDEILKQINPNYKGDDHE